MSTTVDFMNDIFRPSTEPAVMMLALTGKQNQLRQKKIY